MDGHFVKQRIEIRLVGDFFWYAFGNDDNWIVAIGVTCVPFLLNAYFIRALADDDRTNTLKKGRKPVITIRIDIKPVNTSFLSAIKPSRDTAMLRMILDILSSFQDYFSPLDLKRKWITVLVDIAALRAWAAPNMAGYGVVLCKYVIS